MRERLRLHLGYRGTALIFLGLVWFAVGTRILTDSDPTPNAMLPIEYFPISVRAGIWWAAALVALIVAFWLPGKTRWGYMALVIPAAMRAASYAGAVGLAALSDTLHQFTGTDLHLGAWDVWVDALVWSGIVGYVMLCADWPEPPRTQKEIDADGAV